jgi:hypothetical protein
VETTLWKVKKLGLLSGMTPVVPTSSSSSPSSPSSPQRNILLVPRSEENQAVHSAPIERGAGGIEEITSDGEGSRGTQRNAEEGDFSSKESFSSEERRFSSEEAAKEAPQDTVQRNSLRKEDAPSERMRNPQDPQRNPLDSSRTPQRKRNLL